MSNLLERHLFGLAQFGQQEFTLITIQTHLSVCIGIDVFQVVDFLQQAKS